ncbi:nickel ABC transporter ATP-binding protein NikE [Geminicoccus roseus]|uniref:nickel ABC transporter ATP-binding protein NikE n=1 Tax=Geminicoccus roseus TaxID=404900 RepID=UPI000413D7E6|nr:ABC transporter ATP-binding protein [Geminicoccus roseus]
MSLLLEVEDLAVRRRDATPLVEAVSFRLRRGERLGIVGASGSGKSLTTHAIAGLLPEELVASGQVRLDGKEILGLPEPARARLRGRRIAMVFQEPMTALDPARRIGAQVMAPMEIHGLGSRQERQARMEELLAAVGLPVHRHSPRAFPHELSGGQRQRVLIAAALAAEPDLLLADEPTTALDLVTQRQILDLLDELASRQGLALVLVSHDRSVIARMCSRSLEMRAGRVVRATRSTGPPGPAAGSEAAAARCLLDGAPILDAADLVRHYRLPDGRTWKAVDGVSLRIEVGESVGLVGASGSGKSTLSRLLTGLERPDRGQVRLDGRDPAERDAVRHSVQLVFQDPFDSLDPRWKVGRIVAEPLDHDRLARSERQARVAQALAEVELPADAAERHPHQFSGGQRQRIAIARALVARPRLVVLDEPLSALDAAVQEQVIGLLERLRIRHGLTYLLVSHDLEVVRQLCGRVLVLDEGRLVEAGLVDQVLRHPASPAARALVEAVLAPTVAPQQTRDY